LIPFDQVVLTHGGRSKVANRTIVPDPQRVCSLLASTTASAAALGLTPALLAHLGLFVQLVSKPKIAA